MLSSVAGTNTVTATGPANYSLSSTMPPLILIPAVTNTGATTLAITPSGGSVLTAKNVFARGAACVGGELVAGVPAIIEYDGTQYNVMNPGIARITASLGADVDLTDTALFFDGPSVAQGSSGTWFASGTVTILDTAGAAGFSIKLWDGTTVIASAVVNTTATNLAESVSVSGYITSPAGNIRISVKDASATSGKIKYNHSSQSKDSTVSAIRIG